MREKQLKEQELVELELLLVSSDEISSGCVPQCGPDCVPACIPNPDD